MTKSFKQQLRITCQSKRKQIPVAAKKNAEIAVCERIAALDAYRFAKRVALYRAVQDEINLDELWPSQDRTYYFPVMQENKTLLFLPATSQTDFSKNKFGILEPNVSKTLAVTPSQVDMMLLPLVAFDEHGTRIGMGGGFYDRTLMNERSPLLVGVAYEFQRQAFIEPDPWDVPLNLVITEHHTYWSKS